MQPSLYRTLLLRNFFLHTPQLIRIFSVLIYSMAYIFFYALHHALNNNYGLLYGLHINSGLISP